MVSFCGKKVDDLVQCSPLSSSRTASAHASNSPKLQHVLQTVSILSNHRKLSSSLRFVAWPTHWIIGHIGLCSCQRGQHIYMTG
ncbi:hypothetical protein I7I48_08360 [Histoplasma ohiense]|nr:hypothetical protein I7I48_08360 [Histoplasma ohiense (nom. inval.)]